MWIYNSASTITQGSKVGPTASTDADATVLKVKLSLNWTGPFKILEVGPAASAPDKRPLADKVLYLNLPSDMPGASAKPRVTVERCKPCTGHTMPTARGFHKLDYRAMSSTNTPASHLPATFSTATSASKPNASRSKKSLDTNRSVHEAASSLSSTRHTGKAYFALPRNGKWTSATPDDTSFNTGPMCPTNTDKPTACTHKCASEPPNGNWPEKRANDPLHPAMT